ncbi:Protein serine/threonine phosphatase PrpC, regulation of stationary phase [Microbacterium esteraromaticum]|uniref:Protein serine/threonine phosphatase PrpC, regulation of stationary phase n=1 Tax=Microbacterium esteraromaticum TaxID=57043 RepID=A0A1R4KPS9_9MICO|nr:protein phosphatase 2C domain-containing protein [Microbacterium esteraromaticum]SJN46235.1 Protein serine/threonine phosphatase PrpC, regulation of stationary phase [Microbacterium esteraromaticum]
MTAPIMTRSASATDVGARRRLNEDAFLAAAPLFIVADGMGGHDAGEVASAKVVEHFSTLSGQESLSIGQVRDVLASARTAVGALGQQGTAGAGTTLSGVVIASVDGLGYWLVLNIGDSRTYQFSNGMLEQITVDHSYVQELIDEGEITPEQAKSDRRRNIITRAIGAGSVGDADYWLFPAESGDRMLVCSDGLTTELPDERIAEVLATEPDPQRAADMLTAEAVRAGGRDNVTVVIVDALTVASARGVHVHADEADELDDTRPRAAVDGGMR